MALKSWSNLFCLPTIHSFVYWTPISSGRVFQLDIDIHQNHEGLNICKLLAFSIYFVISLWKDF